jgi:hypothetical protein
MRKVFSIFAAAFMISLAFGIQTARAQEDVGRLLKQLEEDSDRFSNSATKALDNSKYDGTSTEDQLIRYVRDFEDSIDRIKKAYEEGRDTSDLAKEIQTRSLAINKFLKKNPLGGNTATDWGTVRADILRVVATRKIKASS